jgi:hypothetical protein
VGDAQAGLGTEGGPLGEAVGAHVAGVAPALEAVHEGVQLRVVQADVVGDEQQAAGAQGGGGAADKGAHVGEVVGGDAADHQIDAGGGDGQLLGGGLEVAQVLQAEAAVVIAGGVEHGGGEVAGDDVAHVGREGEGGVAAAGGDVQHQLVAAGRGEGHEALQVGPLGMDAASDIGAGCRGELAAGERTNRALVLRGGVTHRRASRSIQVASAPV